MKVLVSDNLGEAGIRMFQNEEGIAVDVNTGLSPEELKDIIGEYDGLVIRSATKVTEELLEAATRLKVVGRAGIGLDNVDIPAATKRGIIVMNTPGGNIITTAEHAIGLAFEQRLDPLGIELLVTLDDFQIFIFILERPRHNRQCPAHSGQRRAGSADL